MKLALVVSTPDVDPKGTLALLTGSLDDKLDKARRLGYDGVELMVRDPGALDWAEIARLLKEKSLDVPQIVTGEVYAADGLCLVTADDQTFCRAVERTQRVIDFAASIGAMVNIGRLRGRLDLLPGAADPLGMALERIGIVARYAAGRGVRITLEPINRYEADFLNSAEDGLRFVDRLGLDNVGLMLDLFHMNIEDANIEQSLRACYPLLWHVHIADSNRRHPGGGHLDFSSILSTLTDLGYHGYLSAETIPFPDPDEAAARTIDFLRPRVSESSNRSSDPTRDRS